MTLSEFKAWFEGFSEIMEGPPNEKQWKRIKARVAEINGVAVTKTVFVDRYVPTPWRPYWGLDCVGMNMGVGVSGAAMSAVGKSSMPSIESNNGQFDSHNAMLDLGRAEYSAIFDA